MSIRASELGTFGRRLKALRNARGVSQTELARLIGRHQTAIGPYERDEYMPARDVIDKLADVLDTSPEYLCFGRSPQRSSLPLAGAFGPALILEQTTESGSNAFIALRDEHLLAFRVDDDCMAPAYRRGQHVLAMRQWSTDWPQLLNRHVLAELADDRILLRRLLPSREAGLFDLAAYDAPPLTSVAINACRLVVGALDAEALSTAS